MLSWALQGTSADDGALRECGVYAYGGSAAVSGMSRLAGSRRQHRARTQVERRGAKAEERRPALVGAGGRRDRVVAVPYDTTRARTHIDEGMRNARTSQMATYRNCDA